MAFVTHPSVDEILQVPGYLFWNPTALDSEANWGTKLGFCENGVTFVPAPQFSETHEEEYGEEVRDVIYLGSIPRVTVILQNWNDIMTSVLFPGQYTSSKKITMFGALKPGTSVSTGSTYAKPLLFVPNDRTNKPCLLVQKAVPTFLMQGKVKFSHTERALWAAQFTPVRKTNHADGAVYVGLLAGATLR